MKQFAFAALLCACVGVQLSLHAHHAYTEYQQDQTIEIDGVLKEVEWRNPHVRFVVEVARPNAAPLVWDVESAGINNLNRIGANVEHFRTGSRVRVAGWPSRRGPGRMYVTNIMAQDGHELVMWRFSKPRWASASSGYGTGADKALFAGGVANGASGLFRVWSSDYDDPDASPGALFREERNFPLNDVARKVAGSWDPARQGALVGCEPKGMPVIMGQPFPIEFVDQGGSILVRIEEYDAVRSIRMGAATAGAAQPAAPYGHSSGKWEGPTLVVQTTSVQPRRYPNGPLQGARAHYLERFTPSADGIRLHYTISVTDPDVFTRPVEMKRSWVWRPNEKVMPFNCKT